MGPGASFLDVGPFRLADAWWTFYWWIVVLNALQLAWRIIDLLRGAWQYVSEDPEHCIQDFRPGPDWCSCSQYATNVYSVQESGGQSAALWQRTRRPSTRASIWGCSVGHRRSFPLCKWLGTIATGDGAENLVSRPPLTESAVSTQSGRAGFQSSRRGVSASDSA